MPGKFRAGRGSKPRLLPFLDQAKLSAAEDRNLNVSSLLVLLSIYKAFSMLDRKQAAELGPAGLSRSQFNALTVLHRSQRHLSMRELAEMMAIQQTNLSGVIKGLKDTGMVRQQASAEDERARLVSITKKGEEFLSTFLPLHWKNLERLMSQLTVNDRRRLSSLLDKLIHSIANADSKTTI